MLSMEKIPSLFVRDWGGNPQYVTREVDPRCQWVIDGEGTPTRKYDGTCVLFDGTDWWARREIKKGKAAPPNYVQLSVDPETGKTMGWEPIGQSSFARWHKEVLDRHGDTPWNVGTYELVGPRVNGNPEHALTHTLVEHAIAEPLPDVPRTYDELKEWMEGTPFEGVVWHHPDGRMAKLKAKDFPQ